MSRLREDVYFRQSNNCQTLDHCSHGHIASETVQYHQLYYARIKAIARLRVPTFSLIERCITRGFPVSSLGDTQGVVSPSPAACRLYHGQDNLLLLMASCHLPDVH